MEDSSIRQRYFKLPKSFHKVTIIIISVIIMILLYLLENEYASDPTLQANSKLFASAVAGMASVALIDQIKWLPKSIQHKYPQLKPLLSCMGGISAVLAIVGFAGCSGVFFRKNWLLISYLVTTVILLAAEAGTVSMVFSLHDAAKTWAFTEEPTCHICKYDMERGFYLPEKCSILLGVTVVLQVVLLYCTWTIMKEEEYREILDFSRDDPWLSPATAPLFRKLSRTTSWSPQKASKEAESLEQCHTQLKGVSLLPKFEENLSQMPEPLANIEEVNMEMDHIQEPPESKLDVNHNDIETKHGGCSAEDNVDDVFQATPSSSGKRHFREFIRLLSSPEETEQYLKFNISLY